MLPLTPASRPLIRRFIRDHWGADFVVAHGRVYHPHELPGFAAYDEAGAIVGLITTNDNLNALRFYQKRGFHLCALYPGALAETRRLKPSLPPLGFDGIPLRDELALELLFDAPQPNVPLAESRLASL